MGWDEPATRLCPTVGGGGYGWCSCLRELPSGGLGPYSKDFPSERPNTERSAFILGQPAGASAQTPEKGPLLEAQPEASLLRTSFPPWQMFVQVNEFFKALTSGRRDCVWSLGTSGPVVSTAGCVAPPRDSGLRLRPLRGTMPRNVGRWHHCTAETLRLLLHRQTRGELGSSHPSSLSPGLQRPGWGSRPGLKCPQRGPVKKQGLIHPRETCRAQLHTSGTFCTPWEGVI